MKILVTGSHSELGREIVDRLLSSGHEVVGFDRMKLPDDYPVYSDGEKPKCLRFLGDVRDFAAVAEAVAICDGAIHAAWLADTEQTEDNPSAAVEYNVLGAINVFQACRQLVKRCAYVLPESRFRAADVAFLFNRKHETEIAVVAPMQAIVDGEVKWDESSADEVIYALLGDHFNYDKVMGQMPELERV